MGGGETSLWGQELCKRRGGGGGQKDTKRQTETERNARACLPFQRSSQKERGNRKSLLLKGGLLCMQIEPYAAMQRMYLDYVVTSSQRILG